MPVVLFNVEFPGQMVQVLLPLLKGWELGQSHFEVVALYLVVPGQASQRLVLALKKGVALGHTHFKVFGS